MPVALGDALFWLSTAVCAVAQGAIFRSLATVRRVAPATGVPRPRLFAEVVWALLPALALAAVLTLTYRAIHAPPAADAAKPRALAIGAAPAR